MTKPTNAPAPEDEWRLEQQRWKIHFNRLVKNRLKWAIEHVRSHSNQPMQVADHISSLLALLHQARLNPEFHALSVDLIAALHPWPSRWGYWDLWIEEVSFAAQVSGHLGWTDREAQFLAHVAGVLFYTGRLEEVLETGRQVISLAQIGNAVTPLVIVCETMILALQSLGRIEKAHDLLNEIEDDLVIQRATDPLKTVALAHLRLQRMDLVRRKGHLADAIDIANQIVDQLRGIPDVDLHLLAHTHRSRGVILWARGYYSAAIQDILLSIDLFSQIGDSFSESLAIGNIGLIYWSMGDLVLAESALRRSIEMAERLNANSRLMHSVGILGLVYLSRGQLDEALLYIERQIELAARTGDVAQLRRAQGNRGIVRLHLKEYAAARADLELDLAFVKAQARQEELGCSYVNLSWCYASLGQREHALWLVEQALDIAHQDNSIALQIVSLRCFAEYHSPDLQAEFLRQALALARSSERKLDEAACLLSLASLSQSKEDQASLWEQGRCLLEAIGGLAWLEGYTSYHAPRLPLLV